MPSYLGTFLLGDDTGSYLGLAPVQAIMPRLIIKPEPVALTRYPGESAVVTANIKFEPQHDFNLPFTLSAFGQGDVFTNISFNPSGSGNPKSATITFSVGGSVGNGFYFFTIAATTADTIYVAPLLIALGPLAFCVINGAVIPVVENGFDETSEPLGSSGRSRDGTLVSTVRGYKRTWKFRTEPLEEPEYRTLAATLFDPQQNYHILSGEIVFGEAIRVEMIPDTPDRFKANGGVMYYRLAATMQEV